MIIYGEQVFESVFFDARNFDCGACRNKFY